MPPALLSGLHSTAHNCDPRHACAQVRRLIGNPGIKKDFGALLAGSEGERRKVAQLADLLERCMHLDPDKRLSPKDALRHPFIKEPQGAPAAAKK